MKKLYYISLLILVCILYFWMLMTRGTIPSQQKQIEQLEYKIDKLEFFIQNQTKDTIIVNNYIQK